MKVRNAAVIIFAIILLGLGIFEIIYVNKSLKNFEKQLDEIVNGEMPFAIEKVEETAKWLDKNGEMLVFFVPHAKITEITATYHEMYGAVLDGDLSTSIALAYRLMEMSRGLRCMFEFSIQNIL